MSFRPIATRSLNNKQYSKQPPPLIPNTGNCPKYIEEPQRFVDVDDEYYYPSGDSRVSGVRSVPVYKQNEVIRDNKIYDRQPV